MSVKLTHKLTVLLMLAAILPISIVGWSLYNQVDKIIHELRYEQLTALAEARAKKIEGTFKEREKDVLLLSQSPLVIQAAGDLSQIYLSGKPDSAEYHAVAEKYSAYLKRYTETLAIDDLLIFSPQGDVVYTTSGEIDAGENLRTEHYSDSELGILFSKALSGKKALCSEVHYYEPSGHATIFLMAPILQNETTPVGVVAFHLQAEELRELAIDYNGLGESGEMVLASKKGNQVLMVTPTRHDPDAAFTRTVLIGSEDALPIQSAASGEDGYAEFTDYRGVPVIAAWKYLPFTRLGMVIKIDEAEIFRPTRTIAAWIILVAVGALLGSLIVSLIVARSVARPVLSITRATTRMAKGELGVRTSVSSSDEIGQLAASFNQMAEHLETAGRQAEEKAWIQSGRVQLGSATRGEKDLPTLCNDILACLAHHLNVQVGTFSVLEDDHLTLIGSYAYKGEHGRTFRIGEGLTGQAVREKRQILVTDIPNECITVSSGLGEALPRNIVCIPTVYDDHVNGVIELGSLHPFTELQLELLDQVTAHIAIAIHASQSRERIQTLLEESQAQSEELQTQQEELKTANEELEEQTQALQRSEEELKTQQEAMEVTNEELEEKTEYLEQQKKQLIRAAKDLEGKTVELARSSQYKSEFLANMSHELRTPLNSLLILSGSLAENSDGNLTDDQVESAKVIQSSGKDLLSLINEILDLSKVEAGQMELHIKDVPVKRLAEEVQRDFQHVAAKKGIELTTVVADNAPALITSDSKRIGQILKNLISNAVKFTGEGSVTVTFGSGELNSRPCLAFEVKDTGTGIAPDQQQMIFEAFRQADGTTARKYGGTGLGLSISRELAWLLGGEIQLQSELGKGSVFRVLLPLNQPVDPEDPPENKSRQPDGQAQPLYQPVSSEAPIPEFGSIQDDRDIITDESTVILIIEDDDRFAETLLDQCRSNGFNGLIALSGEEGLHLAEKHRPSAIILDLKLPGINGWSVLDRLKNHVNTRHIPVHIMSAEDPSRAALNNGAIGFLRKPADPAELQTAFASIEDILHRKMKDLLVIEDDATLRKSILQLIGNGDVHGVGTGTGTKALELLRTKKYDCVILDLNLPDMTGFQLLAAAEADEDIVLPPVIVYTGRELTREEEAALIQYSESIIIKGVHSRERLFDETSLFLHRIVENMPAPKQKMIADLHDADNLLKGKTILIADDDMRNLFALSSALAVEGIKTIKAQDGEKALQALDTNPDIDLVLMDIMMPVMDGYETMISIRKNKQFKNLPIIALTAKAMKDDRAKCIEAGADDYLSKPIDVSRLLSLMKIWMYR